MPDVQLKSNEVAIASAATGSLHSNTVTFDQVYVVGDLDGDGIDDALVRPLMTADQDQAPDAVYILYGAKGLTGEIQLDDLPSLTGVGWGGVVDGIAAVGDIDGDGLADVLVTRFDDGATCSGDGEGAHSGVFVIYGSRTRLTGATPAGNAGAYLRNSVACSRSAAQSWLGDLDGDGKADFAIASYDQTTGPHMRLYYGSSTRLSGVVDLATSSAADLQMTPETLDAEFSLAGVGDIDGDGHGDLFAMSGLAGNPIDLRLVHGSATRFAGTLAVEDIARSRFTGNALVDHGAISAPVSPLGDLDGDGFADFAVLGSAPFGQLIFYGRRDGLPAQVDATTADALLLATGTQINPVTKIASGDVDGDGARDLVMTDAGFGGDDGAVYLLRGGRLTGTIDPSTEALVYVGARQRLDRCVNSVEQDCLAHERVGTYLGLGDLRGDGHPSILVSAPWYNFLDAVSDGNFGAISLAYLLSPQR